MQWDLWYDLAVLEMSELSDPAKERLIEAEKEHAQPEADAEESPEATAETPA